MFIACVETRLREITIGYSRLYAYPTTPIIDNSKIIILDSGAFGLSQQGRKMTRKYIHGLAKFYQQYSDYDNIYCIAPDEFKNPNVTIAQYQYYIENYDNKVAPVIQFRTSTFDLYSAKKQIDFYFTVNPNLKMICISNNKFNPVKSLKEIKFIVDYIKRKNSETWIHVLGAGYNHQNVIDWHKTGVNSIDSISYYTDAKHGLQWQYGSDKLASSGKKFIELSLDNLKIANKKREY